MQTHPFTTDLLTKAEAAEFLGIRPRTLDDWREAQAIACIERPGYVRFLRSDLEEFLSRHRREVRKTTPYRPRVPKQQGRLKQHCAEERSQLSSPALCSPPAQNAPESSSIGGNPIKPKSQP